MTVFDVQMYIKNCVRSCCILLHFWTRFRHTMGQILANITWSDVEITMSEIKSI